MAQNATSGLREVELWFRASVAEADELLPAILDMAPDALRQAMAARPELRTVGVMHRLTAVAAGALTRLPHRAHQLTSIVMEHAPAIDVTSEGAAMVWRIEAEAWKEHAKALCALGRKHEARAALAGARERFAELPASVWYLATVDLVEAEILDDLGDREAALKLVRRASIVFAQHGDHERYIEAQMIESGIFWRAGDRDAALEVWEATAETARQRGDRTLLARLKGSVGLFELQHGNADGAAGLLAAALAVFDDAGMTREATSTRWHLARAAAIRGRIHEAVSELYKVRAELLVAGSVVEMGIASIEILELLLRVNRLDEAASVVETLLPALRDGVMTGGASQAFTYFLTKIEAESLTHDDVAFVRAYLEALPQQPNAWFVPPQ